MTEKRDYYEVLGLSHDASNDDIRKAYRQAALKYHPDRNPGDSSAEASFKEATEAYSVLSDQDKRQRYDRFGHAGVEGPGGFDFSSAGMGDILSHFQDIFSDFFGGFGGMGGGGRSGRSASRGQDVRADLSLSLRDAMSGIKREVAIRGVAPCESCQGTGAAPGTSRQRCGHCGGSGQIATQRGFLMFASTCPNCGGSGSTVATPCKDCRGRGHVEQQRKVLVNVPAGIDSGQRLRVPGQGMPGGAGMPAGDLYVDIDVADDGQFQREGNDLVVERQIGMTTAALGGKVEVTLPDGERVVADVAPGTQPGTVLSVRGRGMPRLDRRSARGDLHFLLKVVVPKRLSKKAKKLVQELQNEIEDSYDEVAAADNG